LPNPKKDNPLDWQPWNQAGDQITQRSFLYQVYPPAPQPSLVGPHVYVFDGAKGHQTLDHWDPNGFYLDHDCGYPHEHTDDPECNFSRVIGALHDNGFDPRQVQAVFIKMSTGGPQCDLSGLHCLGTTEADAYTSERYLGNILRYLKHGFHQNPARFPHIHQVFISSRTYGGYAQDPAHACKLNPEPYAYESAFGVQRLIVAQIKQAAGQSSNDQYSGQVDYDHAPWVDWGPYLWTNGDRPRQSDGLVWCNNNQQPSPCSGFTDVRYGDPDHQGKFWGDFTHPTYQGQEKVANQLVIFIGKDPQGIMPGSPFVTPWIGQ
jgi:hypothetical protein